MEDIPKKAKKTITEDLIIVQTAIYELDHYLETNWKLKTQKLKKYWSKIYKTLKPFDVSKKDYKDLTAHIEKYQLHESQLREGLLPSRLSMEYYYYYKSCDVRLTRQLIYNQFAENKWTHNLADWRYFDLITEVNDDIEDVKEDHKTINGNMFLIMMYSEGLKKTDKAFKSFITEIEKKSKQKLKSKNTKTQKDIHKWTMAAISETRKLQQKQVKKYGRKGLKPHKLKLGEFLDF